MKRAVIFVLVSVLAVSFLGIASVLAAESPIKYDGKSLIFPKSDGISPANISGIEFNLGQVPGDKKLVIGKVFRGQFYSPSRKPGSLRYYVFTKWDVNGVEIFYQPLNTTKYPGSQEFLDCSSIDSNKLKCKMRGASTTALEWDLLFRGQKISMNASDGWSADLEVVGGIPVP